MSVPLTIVATIVAKPQQLEFVKAQLLIVVAATRAEEGCLQYDLHQDHNDPSVFLLFENWQSRSHWESHKVAPHMDAYRQAMAAAIAKPTVVHQLGKLV
ncbi:putative quinol monooxygenase [Ferrimonas lipolytica]|uniref:Antibiotic biosynthesis monooxygenase n=1 Tax=Ferrimonas lipolytica TaxID=2724191 RepID=A0A6H1UIL2_9GAMM|nr:putative quinol monooxygenase [Ferrimonas lipolytica]QIZ77632.1 antibiotic biosynthesis monooxygenase [Ferrimonas lipolytica]